MRIIHVMCYICTGPIHISHIPQNLRVVHSHCYTYIHCAHGVISSTVFSSACLVLSTAVLFVEAIILPLLHCSQVQLLVKSTLPFSVAWSLLHIIIEFLYSLPLSSPCLIVVDRLVSVSRAFLVLNFFHLSITARTSTRTATQVMSNRNTTTAGTMAKRRRLLDEARTMATQRDTQICRLECTACAVCRVFCTVHVVCTCMAVSLFRVTTVYIGSCATSGSQQNC